MSAAQTEQQGCQRLSLERLHQWEQLGYGMFIHFGMSTYDGNELSLGDAPSTLYAPSDLDVDQWVSVARDAGMRYAVLTAKHVAGHCLWPSRHTDYHVGASGNQTDVVAAFVKACEKRGVLPGLYYCSWDNHNQFGSKTPSFINGENAYTTQKYRDFQCAQIEELLTGYGPIAEVWIDIPSLLGHEGRRRQYDQIVSLQPNALVMMNNGWGNGSQLKYNSTWPTDLMAIERDLPHSGNGYNPWHEFVEGLTLKIGFKSMHGSEPHPPNRYYIPGEVCDPIGYEWFDRDFDTPRSDAELLGMRLICHSRRANLLLNVPPSRRGIIESRWQKPLMRLRKEFDRLAASASGD